MAVRLTLAEVVDKGLCLGWLRGAEGRHDTSSPQRAKPSVKLA